MRGGLFLLPLYADPEDAAAADAREIVHPVAAEPVPGAEPFNPQRLATLIRSDGGGLSAASETTEMDADVLNSMPKWAQAVVQTGCFNAEAGLKPSPSNKLKRCLESQNEDEQRKRRSVGCTAGGESSVMDEGGKLQDCLDELNAERDIDVEMDDPEELPELSTQAEIAADSVEKFAGLLEKLIDVAMFRQQNDTFECGDLDVFTSGEVKLLLQSLKTMDKNEWIGKLEPDLLISLMSAFDAQVRLGLTLDVLEAMMPNSEKKKKQPSDEPVKRLIATLDVAICELIVMTTPQIDRRVLSEEIIDNCFQLLHHIIRRLLLPCIDTTFATSASTPAGNETNRRQSASGKKSSSSRVNLRTNKNIREAVTGVIYVVCEFMDHLAALVLSVKLADRWLLPLSSTMVELFALEYSSYASSLQQSGLAVLRNIFVQYETHRDYLLGDIVGVMVKLPTTKRTLRTIKLLNSSDTVQQISTLAVSMIQSCAPAVKVLIAEDDLEMLQDSTEASSTPDTVNAEKSQQQNDDVAAILDQTRKSAQSFIGKLLAACWKKSEERDNRVILDNFVEDLLVMFVYPEWVGAEELLEVLSSSLASILHANISKEIKNPDSHYSLAALNLVGKICASIKRYQKKVDHSAVKDDSDSIVVVGEHISSLRAAIIGKNTRPRSALSTASAEWLLQMALKHIVVMHLQRHNLGKSDSKKLLLLKFISESEAHWSSTESRYRERERKFWESLWEIPKGGVDSTFKVAVPSSVLALKSSLHLAVKRGFCGLFDSLLAHIMALLSKGIPTLRARVMKCLRGIVDVDPMLMAEASVQTAVQLCCSDEKPSVREAAVDLIGTYVLLQPLLFDKYFGVLAARLRDKGIKVRKSVCKIFKVMLSSMQNQSGDVISERNLRRKSACMKCLVERVGDASEDQGVKNFIIDTFQEVWFGAELSSSRLSSPLGEFGDGSNLPPGWTAAVNVVDENSGSKTTPSKENVKFVSEDGSIADSIEEAWSTYRTPAVAPSSVVKTNDSKIDNTSEVVSTIVEVIHGMPNFSWFVELLKRLLEKPTNRKGSRSSKNEAEIAQYRSKKIVGGLVVSLMDLQEGKLLQGVSIEEGHSQFLSCMKALAAFCDAKPQLLACHLETLRVYLKEDDVKIQRLAVSMIDRILSVKRPPQTLASKLEDDLRLLVLRSPPSVVDPSVKCLATLSTTTKKEPVLLLQLLERFSLIMQRYKQMDSLATLPEKDNYVLQRALFAAGKIVGTTNIDDRMELANEAKVLKIGFITELLYEWYSDYARKPGNDACAVRAVQGMGFLFSIRPRLFLRAQQDGLLKFLLTAAPGTLTLHCLVSMKELLLNEEQRLENGLAMQTMDRSKSKKQQVQGDQEADASLIGNVMQAELEHVLLLSLQKVPQIRQEAIGCIGALLTQGLVNPLQCIPNLVALETDGVAGIRDAAFSQLLAVCDRFPGQFLAPSVKGIWDSYSFQLRVFGTATALRVDKDEKEGKAFCLFGRLYTTCLKPLRSLFLEALVNQFMDQGTVLKTMKSKPISANSSTSSGNLKYLCYLAQIISTLPYEVEDEPLYIIYLINRYASLRLGPVLDDLKEAFAKAGVAPDQLEDDESNLSEVDIDQYRPLSPLTCSKLAALEMNGCIAFALALMLSLKLSLKANYNLDNEKCATYKPTENNSVDARERSPKRLLLPSVDDLFHAKDPIQICWNLFMPAWLVARKDQTQLDVDLETELTPKTPRTKPKVAPKRRRCSRKAQIAESSSNDEDEDLETELTPKAPQTKAKVPPNRRRSSRKAYVKQIAESSSSDENPPKRRRRSRRAAVEHIAENSSNDEDEYVEGFS